MANSTAYRGFTLLELIVAISLFAVITLGIGTVLITSIRSNTAIWDHLEAGRDGRRAIQQVTNDIRRAEESSVGSYSIASASAYELIIYSNIDRVGYRERVRYFLDGTTFKKGIIVPTGNPLTYATSTESIIELAHDVTNSSSGTPVFSYYGASYTGTEAAMTYPVVVGDIRIIRAKFRIDKHPDSLPSPIEIESVAQLRNLNIE